MSNTPVDKYAKKMIEVIRAVLGIPPPSVTPAQLTSSFPVRKAVMNDKPKPVPFSGLPGYSERGAPEDWDTAMGEVYGYRYWYLPVPPALTGYVGTVPGYAGSNFDKQHGILYGANNQQWGDGRQEAGCTSTSYLFTMSQLIHQPPETREACGCGFWAYFNRDLYADQVLSDTFARAVPNLFSYGVGLPVFGVVKGTGRVIIGEKGFRSQYAQITGLCIPPVAVQQLSWWLTCPERNNERWSHYDIRGQIPPLREKCSKAEHVTRIAQVEAILSAAYPSARLFTSQDLLTQYFPPDKNYA